MVIIVLVTVLCTPAPLKVWAAVVVLVALHTIVTGTSGGLAPIASLFSVSTVAVIGLRAGATHCLSHLALRSFLGILQQTHTRSMCPLRRHLKKPHNFIFLLQLSPLWRLSPHRGHASCLLLVGSSPFAGARRDWFDLSH